MSRHLWPAFGMAAVLAVVAAVWAQRPDSTPLTERDLRRVAYHYDALLTLAERFAKQGKMDLATRCLASAAALMPDRAEHRAVDAKLRRLPAASATTRAARPVTTTRASTKLVTVEDLRAFEGREGTVHKKTAAMARAATRPRWHRLRPGTYRFAAEGFWKASILGRVYAPDGGGDPRRMLVMVVRGGDLIPIGKEAVVTFLTTRYVRFGMREPTLTAEGAVTVTISKVP